MLLQEDSSETISERKSVEKERDQLLEELGRAEARQKEYVSTIMHDKELAIAKLDAAKSLFHDKLQQSLEEKFSLESKLVLAKQDAVELAVQVERLAEIAFQQATSRIIEDAQLRVSAAETSAAEAACHLEEQIRDATDGTILSLVEQSRGAIEKALNVAQKADNRVREVVTLFSDLSDADDDITDLKSENIRLSSMISDLESQIQLAKSEVGRLRLELEQTGAQVKVFAVRAENAEKALHEFQESKREMTDKEVDEMKFLVEKIKKDAADRRKAVSKAFKAELDSIKAAVEAARETACSKDKAYMRRYEILQRSLKASEAAAKLWKQRAETAESLLKKEAPLSEAKKFEDVLYRGSDGRIDLLTDDDSKKWKLLTDGPRRDVPSWMARRIRTFLPKIPPRKTDLSEALKSKSRSLELPKLDEVWSIAHEKPKQGDTLIEHVIEKEIIEKKRKALERALQRKTVQWQKMIPEETKLGRPCAIVIVNYFILDGIFLSAAYMFDCDII